MKATLAVAAALAVLVPVGAFANSLGTEIVTTGGSTTYNYTLTSNEDFDYLTSLHVYSPIPISLITGGSSEGGWTFDVGIDDETGWTDIFWYAPDPESDALEPGGSIVCSLVVPSSTWPHTGYTIPGTQGNWGYETYFFAELGVWVDMPSVPVPMGVATAVPEPASIAALLLGIGCLVRRRITR